MPDFFLDEFLEIEQKNLGQYLILFSILRKADFIFSDFYTSPELFRLLIYRSGSSSLNLGTNLRN